MPFVLHSHHVYYLANGGLYRWGVLEMLRDSMSINGTCKAKLTTSTLTHHPIHITSLKHDYRYKKDRVLGKWYVGFPPTFYLLLEVLDLCYVSLMYIYCHCPKKGCHIYGNTTRLARYPKSVLKHWKVRRCNAMHYHYDVYV